MDWHITIHAHPGKEVPQSSTAVRQRELLRLELPSEWLTLPMSLSFDTVLARLEQLPRLYIEPDGSFIWIGPQGPDQWKFDGQLHDSTGGLMTIELKVSGTDPELDAILGCLDWPEKAYVFQLVREGIYLDHAQVRQLLASVD
ncbi:MAG: hypothetical protein KDB23_07540 [Planctomycetales bacterium]|nr:hypothetical protein [Planctomycetales bacterium]